MPRAFDPSLPGGGLPITHSPLNRIRVNPVLEPFDLQELIDQLGASWENILRDFIFPAIENLTGIDLSAFLAIFDALELDFSDPVAFLVSLIEAASALPAVILQVVVSIFNQILEMTGLDLNTFLPLWTGLDFSNPIAFFTSLVEALFASGTALLGLVPFFGANSAIPIVGAGQIQNVLQNLLQNPFFESAMSFIPGAGIIWDGLTKHSATGGSALFTPNGTQQSLISNAVDVIPGDILDLSIWTKWTGLTGSGPISLILNAYDSSDSLISAATQVIDAVAMPGLTGGWTKLFGSFTIPDGLGVSSIAASFNVSSLLNGGSVWFDDGSITKPNLLSPINMFSPTGLLDTLEDEWALLSDTLANQANATISDIENRLAGLLDNLSILDASNILTGNIATDFIADLQTNFNNLVQQLLGWDPPAAGSWYAPADSAEALGTQASTLLGHGGLLSQHGGMLAGHIANFTNLFNRVTALETTGGGGVLPGPTAAGVNDDFERVGSLGSNWTNTDSAYKCEGHNAYWDVLTYSARTAECTYIVGGSSDYQLVQVVIGDFAPTRSGGHYGWNYVHGRVGGGQKCTFAIRADGYWEFRVSGAIYASGTSASLGIGSSMSLYCGEYATSTLNKFTCLVNNGTIWSGIASSSTGSGYRGWGFGSSMSGTGSPLFGSVGFGGKVNQWSAADVTWNSPP